MALLGSGLVGRHLKSRVATSLNTEALVWLKNVAITKAAEKIPVHSKGSIFLRRRHVARIGDRSIFVVMMDACSPATNVDMWLNTSASPLTPVSEWRSSRVLRTQKLVRCEKWRSLRLRITSPRPLPYKLLF